MQYTGAVNAFTGGVAGDVLDMVTVLGDVNAGYMSYECRHMGCEGVLGRCECRIHEL
jgi:hypothetical protein